MDEFLYLYRYLPDLPGLLKDAIQNLRNELNRTIENAMCVEGKPERTED